MSGRCGGCGPADHRDRPEEVSTTRESAGGAGCGSAVRRRDRARRCCRPRGPAGGEGGRGGGCRGSFRRRAPNGGCGGRRRSGGCRSQGTGSRGRASALGLRLAGSCASFPTERVFPSASFIATREASQASRLAVSGASAGPSSSPLSEYSRSYATTVREMTVWFPAELRSRSSLAGRVAAPSRLGCAEARR